MSYRTVIVSEQSKLDYKMGYMVVRGKETRRVLIDEVSVLVIENPMVSFTGCLIEELVNQKVKVIFCDAKRNPVAELLPHHGSHDSSLKIRRQVLWKDDIKNMVWKEIVGDKIRKQSEFLHEVGKVSEADLLQSYILELEPGDKTNREGHAAKVYFNALFGMDFSRSQDIPLNAALNYGYSIIMSSFNREISANGYLTQMGIFHDNMYNHFNLGCDLMEPFRITVDRMVYSMMPMKFDKEEKHELWRLLDGFVNIDSTKQYISNAIRIYTYSVFDAIEDADVSKIKFYSFDKESNKSEWI